MTVITYMSQTMGKKRKVGKKKKKRIPKRFLSCPGCAFCPRLSLELGQDCPSKPVGRLAADIKAN